MSRGAISREQLNEFVYGQSSLQTRLDQARSNLAEVRNGTQQGLMAIIGTMGLVGIAINDSIMVLSAFNEDLEASKGDPKAAQRVVIKCTRHVVTTTVTTMIGFIPLLADGDPFWRPLAIAISVGIGGASLLALYFVPAAHIPIANAPTVCHLWQVGTRTESPLPSPLLLESKATALTTTVQRNWFI